MSVLHPSSIRPFFMFKPRHHAFPNASSPKRETTLLPNDDVLPTAGIFNECFEENLLPNGALLPNSAHRSVFSLYQFLVLTHPTASRRLHPRVSVRTTTREGAPTPPPSKPFLDGYRARHDALPEAGFARTAVCSMVLYTIPQHVVKIVRHGCKPPPLGL
jgi:hypothetical protein